MKFGIIGAGGVGQALAGHIVKNGHEVVLANRRGPESLRAVTDGLGPLASASNVADAAQADVVFLAVPWSGIQPALESVPDWGGRLLIDSTNHVEFVDGQLQVINLAGKTGSEVVAELAPGSRVIKAFNTLYASYIAADPRHDSGNQVVFFAGNHDDSKAMFGALLEEFGFAGVDIGQLRDGGRLMEMGTGPLAGLHVIKEAVPPLPLQAAPDARATS
jgi:8-hydroxy-5-deazaflavin:NADPH oxidoreductase